ncbi:hypothetical protein ABKN59_010329 [Abortiporus biennis]
MKLNQTTGVLSFKFIFTTFIVIFLLLSTCLGAAIPQNGGAIHGLTTQLQSLVPWTTHSTPEVDLDIAVIQFVQRDQHGNDRQSHWGLVVAGNNYPVVSFSHVTTKGDGKWKLEVHQKWDISSSRSYRGGVLVGKVPQKDLKDLYKIWQMKPSPSPSTENGYCATWVLQVLRKFKEKGWIFSDAPWRPLEALMKDKFHD